MIAAAASVKLTSKLSSAIPLLNDSRCCSEEFFNKISLGSVIKGTIIFIITVSIILANFFFIFTLNSRSYFRCIHQQPRYLLTSLACNDLAIGFFISSIAVLPTLFCCWPYGDTVCQIQILNDFPDRIAKLLRIDPPCNRHVPEREKESFLIKTQKGINIIYILQENRQALLRGSLTRQSSMILMCMAIDRYFCTVHPSIYQKYINNNKPVCLFVICLTLMSLISVFAIFVLIKNGFYFNEAGILGCDLFYYKRSLRIFSACILYFPTTMLLMYCYGKIYNTTVTMGNRARRKPSKCSEQKRQSIVEIIEKESVSRTMSIISLSFIILTTPWTIYEIVTACTGLKISSGLEFVITLIALSNSFWNPLLYWLLNGHFRKIFRYLFITKVLRRKTMLTGKKTMNNEGDASNKDPTDLSKTNGDTLQYSKAVNGGAYFIKSENNDRPLYNNHCSSNNFCPTPPPPPHPFMISKYWRHLYQFSNTY